MAWSVHHTGVTWRGKNHAGVAIRFTCCGMFTIHVSLLDSRVVVCQTMQVSLLDSHVMICLSSMVQCSRQV